METIGKLIAEECLSRSIIKRENKEIVSYGVTQLLFFMLNFTLIQCIGIFLNEVIPAIIYCIVFMSLSTLIGNYHASSRVKCTIKTIFVFFVYCVLLKKLPIYLYNTIVFFISTVYFFLIYLITPVKHKNKKWSEKQIRKNPQYAIILSATYIFISVLLINLKFGIEHYGISVALSVFTTVNLAVFGVFCNQR